jgi:hypothetical protein
MTDEAGARQLGGEYARGVNLDMKVFLGRRFEYGEAENAVRNQVYQDTGRDIDIASYDRIVDVFGWRNNRI